jgi:APA family basic amino acid/polyamine antiporter
MKKRLSVFDLIAFGVGATIGAGIFALTGTAAAGQAAVASGDWWKTPIINFILHSGLGREGAGPAIIISFVIAAIACGLTALCYAELAAMIPVSGSAYTFAYAALGEVIAWIIGWDLILEYAVGNVTLAVSWSSYFLQFFHGMTGLKVPLWLTCGTNNAMTTIESAQRDPAVQALYSSLDLPSFMGHAVAINLPAVAIMVLITWLLVIGTEESAKFNTVMVFIKVAIVLFFIVYGAGFVHPENWVPFAPSGLSGIFGGAAIVFFAFIGFDALSSCAEETKNPQKDMPVAMIGSLTICTILYGAVALILTGILPYTRYVGDAAPVATALAHAGNPWAQMIVCLGALAGMTSVILVYQLGQPRIFMAMSRDGLLPRMFSQLHPKFRTPFLPTILTGVFVAVLAMFVDIDTAAELCNIGTLAAFILVCGGVMMLRKSHPDQHRPFSCPWSPVIPAAGIFACSFLMLSLPILTWVRFVIWMAVGMVIYFCYGYRKNTGSASQVSVSTSE